MPDLLEQASAWLEDQRVKHLTRTVTYQRGGNAAEVLATIGQTVFELDDGAGAMLRVEARDYLVLAADLVLAGVPTLPQRGDRIRETEGGSGGRVFVYEVMAPGDQGRKLPSPASMPKQVLREDPLRVGHSGQDLCAPGKVGFERYILATLIREGRPFHVISPWTALVLCTI